MRKRGSGSLQTGRKCVMHNGVRDPQYSSTSIPDASPIAGVPLAATTEWMLISCYHQARAILGIAAKIQTLEAESGSACIAVL